MGACVAMSVFYFSFVVVGLALGKAAAVSVRLVDKSGAVSNAGLVQVQASGNEYGTVCGMDLQAATVVCRQLGYSFGSLATTPCAGYAGSSACGAPGSSVAMKGLSCAGGELAVADCHWLAPDAACADHASDSVVYCGNEKGASVVPAGSVRLMSHDGAPSFDGSGRLEVFAGGVWSPVCRDGFSAGAASVACAAMGFEGVASPKAACHGFQGQDYCGSASPSLSSVACVGTEDGILACPHEEGDDVFCSAQESVVVSCAGSGNTQGGLQV